MTEQRFKSFALEGPCCAGKTTLGHGLIGALTGKDVAYVRDYSDFVGGGRFLPPPVPQSLTDEETALKEFLCIEAERIKLPLSLPREVIIIDRSIHTLIAHCVALERMTGVSYGTLAKHILCDSKVPLWPDFVLYLDTPSEIINIRNNGKFANDSIFINPDFNTGIRSYFLELCRSGSPPVIWLDASQDKMSLRRNAEAQTFDFWRTGGRTSQSV